MTVPVDRPEYSPAMLALFLRARAIARQAFAAKPEIARRELQDELIAASGLAFSDIVAAFSGRLKDADKRVRLWAVLDHFPAHSGIVLTDEGGQARG